MPWVQTGKLYTIYAVLDNSSPAIWRRLEIEGHCDLGELHYILQTAFGWTNSHLHQFTLPGEKKGQKRFFSDPQFELEDAEDEFSFRLDQILPEADMNLLYEYDFGDSWAVILHVEKISDNEPNVKYPRAIAGERHGPLDDSGGIWGWEENLAILKDPKHEQYEDIHDWFGLRPGQTFDDTCDLDAINKQYHPAKRKSTKKKSAKRHAGKSSATKPYQPTPDSPIFEIPTDADPENLRYLTYEITYDRIEEHGKEWPEEIRDRVAKLYELIQKKPRKAIPEMEALVAKYPDSPRLLNYLINAYGRAGDDKKAGELSAESFRRFPDYLFSRINYVTLLLKDRKTDEAGKILEGKFDIQLLYPERQQFHISEFLSYSMVVGWYLAQKGELEAAQTQFERMAQMEPDAPQTQTLLNMISSEVFGQALKMNVRPPKRRKH